ncbi:biotin-dependent carboxyltransferase family protein [Solemya velum gill symbiont]|uniref:Allophanate hydrolase n=1 Tax=Solemya velum gill symbiont TaxID=2340 RepID=A0A0B0H9F7_SOVGS|nr:biotin-dependent carboxyltransferase family protein [Solemya velum gill symbiont]KHF24494.1 biotin-dependent carboxylase [Solemya velum gill symbiont]OOY34974.1 allophanate hydrolase [Solemya velum gill symbiont]OOY36810.1 allophanate hydrolase [Solemya velum gill symbiont]OOY39830.1 allophanate hydrolase [Solemya velum gill symbiont]OOY46117.1 allophanate hydrolase [Solemya velum gill symbiont]
MSFEVLKPGHFSCIQDLGRVGYQHLGITTGGPMDEHAFSWANRLLGNSPNVAQVEITYGVLSLLAETDAMIAITGADLDARINDIHVAPWFSYSVAAGDRLEFNTPLSGLRAYLAVVGGFSATHKLGSCATVAREGIGGITGQGDYLTKGDRLNFDPHAHRSRATVPTWAIPDYDAQLALGVVPGYQAAQFPDDELEKFFSSSYEVTKNIDRMGYRLSGAAIDSGLDGIISEGICYGAIQVPGDGQPIILMKDRQTIGGYPKIGSLTALGAAQLSQRGPGASVNFYPITLYEAMLQRRLFGVP